MTGEDCSTTRALLADVVSSLWRIRDRHRPCIPSGTTASDWNLATEIPNIQSIKPIVQLNRHTGRGFRITPTYMATKSDLRHDEAACTSRRSPTSHWKPNRATRRAAAEPSDHAHQLATLHRAHGNQAVRRFVTEQADSEYESLQLFGPSSSRTIREEKPPREAVTIPTEESAMEAPAEESELVIHELEEPIPLPTFADLPASTDRIGSSTANETVNDGGLGIRSGTDPGPNIGFTLGGPTSPGFDLDTSTPEPAASPWYFPLPSLRMPLQDDLEVPWTWYGDLWNDGGMGLGSGSDHDRTAGLRLGRERILAEPGILDQSVNITMITPPGYLPPGVERAYPEEYRSPDGPWLGLFYFSQTNKHNRGAGLDLTTTMHIGANAPSVASRVQDTVHLPEMPGLFSFIPGANSPVFADWPEGFEPYIGAGLGGERRFEREFGWGTLSGSLAGDALVSTHRSFVSVGAELTYMTPDSLFGPVTLLASAFGTGTGFLRYNDGRDLLPGVEGEYGGGSSGSSSTRTPQPSSE